MQWIAVERLYSAACPPTQMVGRCEARRVSERSRRVCDDVSATASGVRYCTEMEDPHAAITPYGAPSCASNRTARWCKAERLPGRATLLVIRLP